MNWRSEWNKRPCNWSLNVPQGYVIVRGGGIPAISVMGYNRNVGWRELLDRLKRVTEGNVIVK